MLISKKESMTRPSSVTPEGWAQTLTTLCFPPTEPHLSSDSKSKSNIHAVPHDLNSAIFQKHFFKSVVACPLLRRRYSVAESDCNLAIALDSNYCKAFARRGAARFALQKYESALEGDAPVTTKRSRCLSSAEVNRCASAFGVDYEMVLKLDPGNFEAQREVKKIRQVNLKRVILRVQSVSQGRCCCFLCLFFELFFFLPGFRSLAIRTLQVQTNPHSHSRPLCQTRSSNWSRSSRGDRRQLSKKTEWALLALCIKGNPIWSNKKKKSGFCLVLVNQK